MNSKKNISTEITSRYPELTSIFSIAFFLSPLFFNIFYFYALLSVPIESSSKIVHVCIFYFFITLNYFIKKFYIKKYMSTSLEQYYIVSKFFMIPQLVVPNIIALFMSSYYFLDKNTLFPIGVVVAIVIISTISLTRCHKNCKNIYLKFYIQKEAHIFFDTSDVKCESRPHSLFTGIFLIAMLIAWLPGITTIRYQDKIDFDVFLWLIGFVCVGFSTAILEDFMLRLYKFFILHPHLSKKFKKYIISYRYR